MKVLKATQEQYEALNGFESGISKLEFVKDGEDNWVVGLEILEDDNFAEIKSSLLLLEQIDYTEPLTPSI